MNVFLDSLNPQQHAAVHLRSSGAGALVLAGAGTGKTRVLTGRVIHLIESQQARAHEILAVTFTNKAAREMRERIHQNLPQGTPGMRGLMVGTFHSICHRILRLHAAEAGWDKNFQILDMQDQAVFIRRLLVANNIDPKAYTPQSVAGYINREKEAGRRAADATAASAYHRERKQIYALYEQASRAENKMDFTELMLSVLDLWRGNEEIRQHYAARFRHILVDELQDTNNMQFQWLKLLDSGDNCFFGVGDDDQSIYAFRGAEPQIMRRFQGELRATELVRLEQNYRSVGNILKAANHLIASNSSRIGKQLSTQADDGALLSLTVARNGPDEADAVAERIYSQLHGGESGDMDLLTPQHAAPQPHDFCILYRTNAQARLFEQELTKYQIPYRVYSGLRFYDRAEVKHALAFLRLLVQDDRDSLLRIINMPPRGIGKKTIDDLQTSGDVFATLAAAVSPRLRAFNALIAKFKNIADEVAAGERPFAELMQIIIEESGLIAHYQKRNEEERAENLSELVTAAREFSNNNVELPAAEHISTFLSLVALESAGDADDTPDDNSGNQSTVSLMTVHAAKGLEFNHVHIVGLEEDLFPHRQMTNDWRNDSDDNTEEERRLLYVAITRARQTLSLHYAKERMIYGMTTLRQPSRFLRELPPEVFAEDIKIKPATATRPVALVATPPTGTSASAPAPAQTKTPQGDSLKPGSQVQHPRYGLGVVIRTSGSGKQATADITFKSVGIRSFQIARASSLKKIS